MKIFRGHDAKNFILCNLDWLYLVYKDFKNPTIDKKPF